MSASEFSRTVRADTIGADPRAMQIEAEPAERDALARRFGLAALDRLEADVSLVRSGQDIVATGRVAGEAVQGCVVTGAPVPVRIDEPFAVRFRPVGAPAQEEQEVELGEDEMDIVFCDGATIDVGEAAAQSFALALDPYPRAEGAGEALKEAGVKDEGEAGPFGALAGLKAKFTE